MSRRGLVTIGLVGAALAGVLIALLIGQMPEGQKLRLPFSSETVEETANAILQTDCKYFEEIHRKYWQAYNEPKPPPLLTREEAAERTRKANERLAAKGSDFRWDPETGLPEGVNPIPWEDPWTSKSSSQTRGWVASLETAIRNWPLVEDDTLQYLMKEMAESSGDFVFQRNFLSASSVCNLPDLPND
jgi:hypothetical protein